MAKIKDGNFITNQEDIDYILSLNSDNIKMSTILDIFGSFDGKRRFQPYDYIKIPKNSYGPEGKRNKNEAVTTVGLWVFNRLCIEKDLFDLFGYINKQIDGGTFKKINKKLSYARLEEDITLQALKDYLNKTQLLMRLVTPLSANYTEDMLTVTDKINKRKMELVKKYKEELQRGDEVIAEQMEKELLAYAKDLLKDDESIEIYDSGSRCSFGNHFKNMFIMKGAVLNPDPNKGFDIALSNYMDGISKEEYHIFANSLVGGPYSRARKTEVGGYWEKLFLYALQHIQIKYDYDCGTKRFVTVDLTDQNVGDWMYSYIIDGSKLVELTSKTSSKYIGKTVKMRFSSMCEYKDGICEKCAGTMFKRLNAINAGMMAPTIPATLKQKQMKAFHDSVVKTTEMDLMKAFSLK